jgi:hypothetical protein
MVNKKKQKGTYMLPFSLLSRDKTKRGPAQAVVPQILLNSQKHLFFKINILDIYLYISCNQGRSHLWAEQGHGPPQVSSFFLYL